MGKGAGPGSTGGRDEGRHRRFDHLAKYAAPGAYIVDEETGEYSQYEVPEDQGVDVTWADILGCPRLIANDFLSEYGIDLAKVGNALAWREFELRIEGLLACDSRLSRHLYAKTEKEAGPDDSAG